MSTYTIDHVQLSEAQVERLVQQRAERLAQPRYLALSREPGCDSIYRIQPDGTGHYVAPTDGHWALLPYKWPTGISTTEIPKTAADAERQIALRTPKPPVTFAVGDWVMRTASAWSKAQQVIEVGERIAVRDSTRYFQPELLRHATPEEVWAAKAITPVVGMIVQHSAGGGVWRYDGAGQGWTRLDKIVTHPGYLGSLTTDHYTVLDSYTVQGAR